MGIRLLFAWQVLLFTPATFFSLYTQKAAHAMSGGY
jgi:hypothetical protein